MTAPNRSRRRGLDLLARPDAIEAAWWRKLRLENHEASRTKLFDHYTPLARASAAKEWRRRPAHGLDRGDFQQFALVGLLESIDRFDPLRGAPFEAFARQRIRGAISDGIARSSEAASQYTHKRRLELERLNSLAAGAETKDPVDALRELAVGLAIGLIAEDAAKSIQSIAAPEPGPYETHAWRDMQNKLMAALEALKEPDRTILRQHYLHGIEFAELAKLLSLSRARISQIHRSALMALRGHLRYHD